MRKIMAVGLLAALAGPAGAVSPVPFLALWGEPSQAFNLVGGRGVDSVQFTVRCVDLAMDANGLSAASYKYSVQIEDGDAATPALSVAFSDQSARGSIWQSSGGGTICQNYAGANPATLAALSVSAGLAKTGSAATPAVIVLGSTSPDAYSILKLAVRGIHPTTGAVLWQRATLAGDNTGLTVDRRQSGLGDFLGGDGIDEVRWVRVRYEPDQSRTYQVDYIRTLDGATLSTQTYIVPAPP